MIHTLAVPAVPCGTLGLLAAGDLWKMEKGHGGTVIISQCGTISMF